MSIYRYGTMSEVVKLTDEALPVFTDTETDGLYGKIVLLQVYQANWDQVILVHKPNHLEVVAYLAKVHSVWHNAHYDLTTVAPKFVPKRFDDTFLLSRLAQPQFEKYSLDEVMSRVHGFDPYEAAGLDKKVLQKSFAGSYHKKLTEDQELYAAIDVYYMPQVWDDVCHKLDDMSYILDKSTLVNCLDFQWNGIPVQEHRIDEEYNNAIKSLRAIPWVSNKRVHSWVHGKHTVVMPFNPNSPKQVREELDLVSTAKGVLSEQSVMFDNQEAQNVLDARMYIKRISFIEKYSRERVVGKFKPSARSGRLTSDDENLQQIPRALKTVFGTTEDKVFIYSDYAQLELRTICAILGVTVMEQLFREDKDLHGYVASILFGEDWGKSDRQVTKTYNFNLLYGGSVKMVLSILITYGMYIQERLATRHKTKSKKKKTNQTTPDQNGTDAKLCNFVHDSYIVECDNDPAIYEPLSMILAECMQEAWFEMSKLYKIHDLPMPVDVKVGQNWGDLEEDKNVIWEFTLDSYKMLEGVA